MTIRMTSLTGKLCAASAAAVACAALAMPTQAASYDFTAAGDGTSWEDVGNWLAGGVPAVVLPGGGDDITVTGGGVNFEMDADSWNHFVTNSLLTGGASGEYRNRQLRVGQFGTSTLSIDIGDGNVWRVTNNSLYFVGSQSGSNGTLNINSGDVRLEGSSIRIAEKTGSTGLINISGGPDTRLIAHRETGGVSMEVGTGGNGTFQIDSGKFRTRAGVTVGSNGTFRVLGSNVTEVSIGDESSIDGKWAQHAGGILEFGIDALGVTPVVIADKGGAGTSAVFDSGSVLDVSFLAAAFPGTWTVLEVENGAVTDNGLSLAAGAGWSYDVDNSGANGLLTVTYVPEPASLALLGLGGLMVLARKH